MSELPTVSFDESDRGLFSPAQVQQLMRVELERARRHGYPLVLMLISVDRLGNLHDLYGYDSKREILRSVMGLLQSSTRASDFLGCLVDDRILALVPHTPARGAGALARRLLKRARSLKFESDGRGVQVTLSIGSAHNERGPARSFEELLQSAETGLAVASSAGGDRHVEWKQVESEVEELRHEIEDRSRALQAEQAALATEAARATPVADETLRERIRAAFGALGPLSPALARLEAQVAEIALAAVQEERDRAVAAKMADHRDQVDQLNRRIAKLTNLLGVTEDELQRVMALKNVDPGISSIYRTVQGLSADAKDLERKREMMEKIFAANLALRKKLSS
jgi:diguanylate cyclase (GGDEF)-like protein